MNFFGIIKLDFYNLYRKKTFKISLLLPILTVLLFFSGTNIKNFLDCIRHATFFLSLALSPILISGIILASEDDEIFTIVNINSISRLISKVVNIIPIILYSIILVNGFYYAMGIILGVDTATIYYYIKFILIYCIVYSIIYTTVGYIIGALLYKIINGVFAYIIGVLFIYYVSGINDSPVRRFMIGSLNSYLDLNPFKFDLYTINNMKIWLVNSLILFIAFAAIIFLRQRKKIGFILVIPILMVSYFSNKNIKIEDYKHDKIYMYDTVYVDKKIRYIRENSLEELKDEEVIYKEVLENSKVASMIIPSRGDEGFVINSYDMQLNLGSNFHNVCRINLILKEDIKELKFSFYGKNKIKNLLVNGESIKYSQDSSNLAIDISDLHLKEKEEVFIEIEYTSYIFTYTDVWEYHFVNDVSAFLDRNLAWYPKIMDNSKKKYNIEIITNHENLFSNLQVEHQSFGYTLKGESNDVLLLSGDKSITYVEKDGIKYYGNDIQVKDKENIEGCYEFILGFKEIAKNNPKHIVDFSSDIYDLDSIESIDNVFLIGALIYQMDNSIQL